MAKQAVAIRKRAIPPAEIQHPKEAEWQMQREKAVLDVMRRAGRDLRQQVTVLRRIIEYAVKGANLIDEMRKRGELVGKKGGGSASEVRTVLADLELSRQRVDEWFSLRDHGALEFLDQAIADDREATFRKASINWIRERVERMARENEAEQAGTPAYDSELRHGDLRTALDDLVGQVDAIITDPPYKAEFLGEFDALGEVSARLLSPDGLLAAMVGHAHLPDHLHRLSQHLTYRWCAAYLMRGPDARVFHREVGAKWKPIVIFDRDNERRFLVRDVFNSTQSEKPTSGQIDGWQQSVSGMVDITQAMVLRHLDSCIRHAIEHPPNGLRLNETSGVYVLRGPLEAASSGKQKVDFAGPHAAERLDGTVVAQFERRKEFYDWLNGGPNWRPRNGRGRSSW